MNLVLLEDDKHLQPAQNVAAGRRQGAGSTRRRTTSRTTLNAITPS